MRHVHVTLRRVYYTHLRFIFRPGKFYSHSKTLLLAGFLSDCPLGAQLVHQFEIVGRAAINPLGRLVLANNIGVGGGVGHTLALEVQFHRVAVAGHVRIPVYFYFLLFFFLLIFDLWLTLSTGFSCRIQLILSRDLPIQMIHHLLPFLLHHQRLARNSQRLSDSL